MSQQALLDKYYYYFPYSPDVSDAEKWLHLQALAEKRGYTLPEYEEAPQHINEAIEQPDNNFQSDLKTNYENSEKYLPSALRENPTPTGLNSVLTDWSAANEFAESGDPLGLGSEDYWKWVYNTSMAGLWYKTNYGKDRWEYTDEHYEPGVLEHITGFFASLASPLDLASLSLGGAGGKIAQKGVTKGLLNRWAKEGIEEVAENQLKKKVGRYNIARGSAEMGGNLATFTGSHAALGSAAEQSEEVANGTRDKIDYWKVLGDTGSAMLESGLVGAATGGIVRGPMATQYAYSKLAQNPGLKQNLTKLATNPISQVGVEGLAFTTIPHVLAEAGIPGITSMAFSDEQFTWNDYLDGLMTNYGIIGSMKMVGAINAPRNRDVIDIVKSSYNIATAKSSKERKHLESVRDNLLKEGIDPGDIVKEITNRKIQERAYIEEQEYLMPILKQIQEYSKKGFDNLTDVEKKFMLQYGVIGDGSIAITRSISDLLKDKDSYFEALEGVLGKKSGRKVKLTEDEKSIWEAELRTVYDNYMYAKEQANASSIGREVIWDKPWSKEDAQIIFARNDMGQGKYWIKTKDKNEHLFEKLEFETREQAQSYLNKAYDNIETMVQKSGKDAEITDNTIIDVESALKESVIKHVKEKVERGEDIEATGPEFRQVQETETVKMAIVGQNKLPVYTGLGLDFKTIDVPISKVSEFQNKGYDTASNIMQRQSGAKAIPLGTDIKKPHEVSMEEMRKMFKEEGEKLLPEAERMERESIEILRDRLDSIERAQKENRISDELPIEWEVTRNREKVVEQGSAHEFLLKNPESKKKWDLLPEYSIERQFILQTLVDASKNPKHTSQVASEAYKFIDFVKNERRKPFENITIEDMRKFLYAENREVSQSILNQVGYKGPKLYRNIVDSGNSKALSNIQEVFKTFTGDFEAGRIKFTDKLYGRKKEFEDMYSDAWKISNEAILEKKLKLPSGKEVKIQMPPQPGVRKAAKVLGQELSKSTGNEGYNLSAELGAKYYLRREEIAALTNNFKVNNNPVKNEGNYWYLDLVGKIEDGGFRKSKSFNRKVWLEEGFAKELQNYINKGGDLSRPVTELGRELSKYRTEKKEKVSYNRPEIAFLDLRKRAKSKVLDTNLTAGEMEKFNWMMGHDVSRISQIYVQKSIKKIAEDQMLFHSMLKEGISKYKEQVRFQRTISGKAPSVTDRKFNDFLQQQIRKNKGAKVNITAEDLNYAGRYAGGVIDIVLGKANYKTWFHENAHALQDYIYSVGNKELIKLWESAEGRFRKDAMDKGYFKKFKDPKEAMDEFMADTISSWALKQQMPKSLSQRISNFVKRIYSKTKQALFGKESLNEKDLVRILGEDVWKGFERGDVEYGTMERFQMVDLPFFEKNVRKLFKQTMNKGLAEGQKYSRIHWNKLKTMVAEAAGIENPEGFQFAHAKFEQLVSFRDALGLFKGGREVLTVKKVTDIQDKLRVNQARIRAGVTDSQQMNILKAIGVKDGKMDSANEFDFRVYKEMVSRMPKEEAKRYRESFDEDISTGILADKGFGKIVRAASDLGVMPTFAVIEQLGLKKISSRLHDHMSMELDNAKPYFVLEEMAVNRVGRRAWEGGLGKSTGIRDALWTVDHERYVARKKENLLTREDKKFVKKAFTKEYVDATEPIKGSLNKYIRRTNEGNIVREYNKATAKVKEMFHSTLKSLMNKAEYDQWLSQNNVKWLEDGTFFTRSLSKEYREHVNPTGKAAEKLIREDANKIERELIEKEPRNRKITDERYEEIKDAAYSKAESNFVDAHQFGSIKFNSPHLLSRGKKLPETIYVPELKKTINVYETKWENSGKKYFLSMAKLLANMEFFPEYVSVKGTKFPGVKTAISKLGRMSAKGKKYERFVNKAIEKQLGISEEGSPFDLAATWGERAATFLAKTQLSSPTSGFKNLMLGSQMTVSTFGLKDFLHGIIKALDKDNRHDIKMSGHTQVGIRHLDRSSKGLGAADTIFKIGMMKPTEDINRYVSVLAGKNHFNRQVKLIQRHKDGSRHFNRAKETLESFYKMDEAQISYLKEYGIEGAKVSNKRIGEVSEIQRKLDVIYQKANAMAHINTQGASLQLFMPHIAGLKGIKPLTLYKRMAFAATTNTLRNTKDAMKDIRAGKPSGLIKLAMQALGPYVAGEVMLGTYHFLLGEDPPKENSSWVDQLKVKLWKGEFGGILSDLIWVFGDKDVARQTLNPAIISYAVNTWGHITGTIAGNKSFDQFREDVTKQTFAVVNAYKKVVNKKLTPYNRGYQKFNKLWYDWMDEEAPDMGGIEINPDRNTKWDRDLREAWNADGPTEEFIDLFISTILTMTHAYHNDYEGKVWDFNQAFEKARKRLEKKITHHYNPNPAFFRDKSELSTKRKQIMFIKWLSRRDPEKGREYHKELAALGKEYDKRVSLFSMRYKKRLRELGF